MAHKYADNSHEGNQAQKVTVPKLNAVILFFGKDLVRSCVILTVILLASLVTVLLVTIIIQVRNVGCVGNTTTQHTVEISKEPFGSTQNGTTVHRLTFTNKNGMELQLLTYGGRISSIKVPDKNGIVEDIVLGYDTVAEYESVSSYFGAIIGRVANRISKASFNLDGKTHKLSQNDGENTLHGGPNGWHTVVWESAIEGDTVRLWRTSPDGEEGYPGTVLVNVTFQLTGDNQVIIRYSATSTGSSTPINLSQHPMYNMAGEGTGDIYDQEFQIKADRYTPTDQQMIPTGEISDVTGTVFDLRRFTTLSSAINVTGSGYDTNFCINGVTGRKLAARVRDPVSHRTMEIFTDQPGLQFYTGNFNNIKSAKNGHTYGKHSGFTMETQNYPDAINQRNFPDSVLIPGSTYSHNTWLQFSTMAI